MACALRILFKISGDESRNEDVTIDDKLTSVCGEALTDFLELKTEQHREAWTCLLLLMMTRMYKMPSDKVTTIRQ